MTARVPSDTSSPVYRGAAGTTRTSLQHYTCPCGTIVSTEVYRSIDVSAQPELRQRMLSDEPQRAVNAVTCPGGEVRRVDVPVVYHDPDNRLFVLVLPESARNRELGERAALLGEIAADSATIPPYVRDFAVVFGTAGLNELLRARVEGTIRAAREAEQAKRDAEQVRELRRNLDRLEQERAELRRIEAEISQRIVEIDRRRRELDRVATELEHRRRELDERARAVVAAESAPDDREQARDRRQTTQDDDEQDEPDEVAGDQEATRIGVISKAAHARSESTNPFTLFDEDEDPDDDGTEGRDDRARGSNHKAGAGGHGNGGPSEEIQPGQRPEVSVITMLDPDDAEELGPDEVLVTDQVIASAPHPSRIATSDDTAVSRSAEPSIERWKASGDSVLKLVADSGIARIAVSAPQRELEPLLGPGLELRVQLHRFPTHPLVNLAVGAHGSFDGANASTDQPPLAIHFDMADESERLVLQALRREFVLSLELFDDRYGLIRARTVSAPLGENVRYVIGAADEHMSTIDPRDRSFTKAVLAFSSPDYDRYGLDHPERREWREDKLDELSSAQNVRRALAIADRFTSPKREDYLFMLRGYPLELWQDKRRRVLARALELGIWVGARLAVVAVHEGLARNHKDLIEQLQKSFASLLAGSLANDLDPDAISDNWAALAAEARSQREAAAGAPNGEPAGKARRRIGRSTPIDSASEPIVSGTIATPSDANVDGQNGARNLSVDELLAALEQDDGGVEAAAVLARRREARAIAPVMAAVARMNRADAGRVLGAMPSFGDDATSELIAGLSSHKSYLRQGCALALAVLKNEIAVEALCDLLVEEPTQLWREVARGLGVIGPSAIMSLATRLSNGDESAHERVAWAMAHIAARGGKKQIRQLASGRDITAAAVARRALELVSQAKNDDLQVRGRQAPREQTINRAFSRRFFASLEAGAVVDVAAVLEPDTSNPPVVLDEADLLETADLDDDAAELLDESDLIPT